MIYAIGTRCAVSAGSRLGKGTGALLARASHLLKWPKTAPEDEEEEAERNDDAPSLVGSSPANNKLQTASKASTAASIYSSGPTPNKTTV